MNSGTDGTGAAPRSVKRSPRLDATPAAEGEEVAIGVPVDPAFEVPDDDNEADLRPDRSVELIALGIAGWMFDCAVSVARVLGSLVRRPVGTRT